MQSQVDIPLACQNLRVTVPGRLLVDQFALTLQAGEFVAILGQNGAGKSLTLQTLAGLRRPAHGVVLLDGENIFGLPRRDVAQRLALLLQAVDDIFPATVLETALIGRHPHIRGMRWETQQDLGTARDALTEVGLAGLETRDVLTLSGGERRRLAIAQLLAQAPAIFLLDEPTNHLDPQHQIDTMHTFRRAADRGACVLASLHDVNLAVRFADRCVLLFGDGSWRCGATEEVLTATALGELYQTGIDTIDWRGHQLFVTGGDSR